MQKTSLQTKTAKTIDLITRHRGMACGVLEPISNAEGNIIHDNHEPIQISRYFWEKWRLLLGNSLAFLIIDARDKFRMCEESDEIASFDSSMEDFAQSLDLSVKQIIRLLKKPYAEKFIQYELRYHYDPEKGKKVKGKCLFRVSMLDPFTPDDETNLTENAPLREPPKGHNWSGCTTLKVNKALKREHNIYNIINNIYTTTANGVKNEKVVVAVRKYFKNKISAKKIHELIENTSLVNIQNQLEWIKHRDNSWADNGPVAAFVTYCEQELEKPECLRPKLDNEKICINPKIKEENQAQEKYFKRRKKYKEPERYDQVYQEVIQKLIIESVMGKAILNSSFIGDIKETKSITSVTIDVSHKFHKNWLEKNYMEKILGIFREKFEGKIFLEIVADS